MTEDPQFARTLGGLSALHSRSSNTTHFMPAVMKALIVVLLIAAPAIATDDPRIAEGTALHDAGRYDDAIAKYKAVLADDPANGLALYELAYSYQAKGDFAKCRTILEPLAGTKGKLQPQILTSLANCLDGSGDAQGAVAAYRKALSLAPDDPGTLYNLGIALMGQSKFDEARDVLKKELSARPGHANGHYALGRVFEVQTFRAAAVLEYLRFLAIEPSTSRSKDVAARLLALLNQGVENKGEKNGKKNINVTINPSSRTEEGDFHSWEMGMVIAAGARFSPENEKASEFDIGRDQLQATLSMLVEMKDASNSYSGRQNFPFLASLSERKLLDTFCGLALSSLGLKGGDAWMKQNAKGVQDFAIFMKGEH